MRPSACCITSKSGQKGKGDTGLRVMSAAEFNKTNPATLTVSSMTGCGHLKSPTTTGWIYVEYRFGGESAVNFLEVMINAMQERGSADVLHGVPKILFTDPGSALVSASLLNMCRAMGIRTIQHKAHNARATGSVERPVTLLNASSRAVCAFSGWMILMN